MINTEELLKGLMTLIEKCVGDSKQSTPNHVESETEIVKSVDQMEKRAMFVVLEPQNDDGTTSDLHGDWYSAQDIESACNKFNVACRKASLMHESILSNDDAVIEQSYIAPVDFTLDTGETVKKGSWVQWWKFNDDTLWQGVLDGTYNGLSIECSASGYEVE